ncbi:FkbM family methyltransferase [Oscillospiraceae bacterium 44-34]
MDYQQNWKKIKEIVNSTPMPEASDTLFLFGGGLMGALAVSVLKDELEIIAVCDNDTEKQNLTIEGLPCISPQKLSDYKNPFVFISTVKYYPVIHQQLTTMGVRHCCLDAYVVRQHLAEFETVFQMLDNESRRVYAGILLCRVSGDVSDAEKYCCDNQYFCLPKFRYIHNEKGAFVDCGAFVGDTLEEMVKRSLGTAPKLYAFEPGERAFDALKKRTSFLCDIWAIEPERIICEKAGVGEKRGYLSFREYTTDLAGMSFTDIDTSTKNAGAEIVDLDSYFTEKQEENISFIKADIEGSEWAMLRGAKGTIQRCKPKLAICVYHSIYDFFRIPLFLKNLVPEYQFMVRHHGDWDEETVLYCFISERK